MKITDFDIYSDLLKEKSGLSLTPDKSYLLESRLGPVAKSRGFDNLDAMTAALKGVPDPALITEIVEAMTTNETSFFRDMRPFDIFKETVMPYIKEARATKRKLRIWCAAASSGQEPYTLAILLNEMKAEMPGWNFEIVATDISRDVLDLAKRGLYSQFEVQRGLPITLLMKYFTQVEDKWQINDEIKSYIKYDYFNLLDPMSRLGTYDIIFCRNVLIYFDQDTKGVVLGNMSKLVENDGFLFLGGAETVIGITDKFMAMPEKRGLYVVPGSVHLTKKDDSSAQALA
jgi:chemotaxis protein methyltransferase CheR